MHACLSAPNIHTLFDHRKFREKPYHQRSLRWVSIGELEACLAEAGSLCQVAKNRNSALPPRLGWIPVNSSPFYAFLHRENQKFLPTCGFAGVTGMMRRPCAARVFY